MTPTLQQMRKRRGHAIALAGRFGALAIGYVAKAYDGYR